MTNIGLNTVLQPIEQILSKVSSVDKNPIKPSDLPQPQDIAADKAIAAKQADANNAFFKWDRVKKSTPLKSTPLKSINPVEAIDLAPLKGLSNEALITKLSAIELSLNKVESFAIDEQSLAEVNLGRMMIGEQIRRLMLIVEGKNSQHGIAPKISIPTIEIQEIPYE